MSNRPVNSVVSALRNRFVLLAIALTAALIMPGCLVETQKASEAFADGRMPARLFRLANQIDEIIPFTTAGEFLARLQREAQADDILEVAVIDNGVDLAHPDLRDRYAFTVAGGRVVGAGYDAMGDDGWASANLINPGLYAFGCRELTDGKIVDPPANPLGLIEDWNAKFVDRVVRKIADDEVLSKSLFAKINASNFTLFGAQKLLEGRVFTPARYAELIAEGVYIRADGRAKLADRPDELKKMMKAIGNDARYWLIVDSAWELDPDSGLPWFGELGSSEWTMLRIEGADRFWSLLGSEFDALDAEVGYKKAFSNFAAVSRSYQRASLGEATLKDEALKKLNQALAFQRGGVRSLDPALGLKSDLKALIFSGLETKQEPFPRDFRIANHLYLEEMGAAMNRFQEVVEHVHALPGKSAEKTRKFSGLVRRLGALRKLVEWHSTERSWPSDASIEGLAQGEQAQAYRRYLYRTTMPYVSRKSNSAAHATHVSGIIARQNERIRIVPVRVTTQSAAQSKGDIERTKANFRRDLEGWISSPLPFRAIGATIGQGLRGVDFSDEREPNRGAVARELIRRLTDKIEMAFEPPNNLEGVFFREILQAIEYVGKRKIKLANVSLGTRFAAPVARPVIDDPDQALTDAFEFLRYEMYKYRLAETMATHAPKALFVVAAGNDGNWIDGQSRSALPVDLSSPFLADFEKPEEGLIAPNNHVTNVLGVGSISPTEQLSSFTNILLGSNTPFVFAHGESILSPIKTSDLSAIEQIFERRLPELKDLDSATSGMDDQLKPFFEARKGPTREGEGEEAGAFRAQLRYDSSMKLVEGMVQAAKLHLFLKHPSHRARMSGTSMATPATTGLLGDMTLKKAAALGVSARSLYDHPEFAPEVLIDEILRKAGPLPGSRGRGIALNALFHDVKWDPSPEAEKVDEILLEFAREGAPAPRP